MITVKVTQLGLATEDLSAPKRVVLAMQIDRWPGEARWRAVFVEGAVGETDYTHDQFQFDHDETDGPVALVARAFARLLRERGLDPMAPTHREG
jgi:hypothetical protein